MDIIIQIKIIQTDSDGQTQVIKFETPATIVIKGDSTYINYKEKSVDTGELTKTSIKVNKDSINIIRFGDFSSNISFNEKRDYSCQYETPYGTIDMNIVTNKLFKQIENDNIEISLDYNINLDEKNTMNNKFSIISK